MANGILIVDKPAGWTSMDVCAKLRGKFREKRVGHGGTLDPMATGILPVFFGRATRGVEYATDSQKEYIAGLKEGEPYIQEEQTSFLNSGAIFNYTLSRYHYKNYEFQTILLQQ